MPAPSKTLVNADWRFGVDRLERRAAAVGRRLLGRGAGRPMRGFFSRM